MNGIDVETGRPAAAQTRENPPANNRTNDAEEDVYDGSLARGADDLACGQPQQGPQQHPYDHRHRAPMRRWIPRALITTAAPTPTTATAAFPISATPDEPHDEQQHDRAYRGVEDRRANSDPEMDPEPRQQPAPNEGTDDPDDEVTNKPKTIPAHDLAGQPAGDYANQQDNNKTFTRHVHGPQGEFIL